jgi:chorismate mutase/prephenate dehydratase
MADREVEKRLQPLRDRVRDLDRQIIDLINARAKVVTEIGEIKAREDAEIFHPGQEKEVYRRIEEMNAGPLSSEVFRAIYREIMSGCIALEKKLLIAYLGPAATFTHQAALARFGAAVEYLPVHTIGDVFTEVETGHADYGVVPIENSTEGAVNSTLDMLSHSTLKVCSEILHEIAHCLVSNEPKEKIRKVYSKSEAIGQCNHWLRANLPTVELVEVGSTAVAAERAAREPGAAAVAGELAAQMYGLQVVERNIEDIHHNVTRFLVIGKQDSPPTGDDKTSLMFSTKDRVGALHEVLGIFRDCGINLSMIESRPSRKKAWEYYFFTDFDGHVSDPQVEEAIKRLEGQCQFVKILGSYPKSFKPAEG